MRKILHFLLPVAALVVGGLLWKHSDGTSIYAGGWFVIPVGLLFGASLSFWRAYRQATSGSWYWNWVGTKVYKVEDDVNVPYYKIGAFWYGVIFTAAYIGAMAWEISELT